MSSVIKVAKTLICFIFIVGTLLPGYTNVYATSDLINSGFETGDLQGWTKGIVTDSMDVVSQDNFTTPYSGNYMLRMGTAVLSNAINQPMGPNEISKEFINDQDNLSFHYNVFTYDYTGYDEFKYELIRTDTNQTIASFIQGGWGPGGDTSLKNTGWQTANIDVSQYKGIPLKLKFSCSGTKDTLYGIWCYIDFDADNSGGNLIVNQQNNSTTVTEGGGNSTYSIKLSNQPTSDVQVKIETDSQLIVANNTILFTPNNWNEPQTVEVAAADDGIFEGNHYGKITHTISSKDATFNGKSNVKSINILDNDTESYGKYTITSQISSGLGSVSPSVQSVESGSSAALSIVPEEGYIAQVMDNGVNVTNLLVGNVYTIKNVSSHHSIVISFLPTTPPKVLTTSPLNGKTDIDVNSNIEVYFTEDIVEGQTFNEIQLKDSAGDLINADKTVSGNKVIINPLQGLQVSTHYTVMVPQGAVKNSMGNQLMNTFEFSFTTQSVNDESPADVTINGIYVKPDNITLYPGQTSNLSVVAQMSDGTNKDVTLGSEGTHYTSSDTNVATVGTDGLISIPSNAPVNYKSTITVEHEGKKAYVTVTVIEELDPSKTVSSLSSDIESLTLTPGNTHQLEITAMMGDGSTKDVTEGSKGTTYSSSNTSYATVDANGLIKVPSSAPKNYKATITVKNGGKILYVTVLVGDDPSETVSSLSVENANVTLAPGATKQLAVTATMADNSTEDVTEGSKGTTYSSSNTSYATVDANGLIKVPSSAPKNYKATITVKNGGKLLYVTVLVG